MQFTQTYKPANSNSRLSDFDFHSLFLHTRFKWPLFERCAL